MKRLAGLFGAVVLVAAIGAPVVLAADEDLPTTGRVLMAFGGDIAVPAGEQADVVFVANGDADIAGTVNTLTVIDGNATLRAATVEHVVVVSGSLALEDGSTVLGDVRSIESTVTQAEGTEIAGAVKGVDAELIALGAFLGPALLLFAIGLLLVIAPFALSLPSKASAGERMMTGFQPIMQPDQVATTTRYYNDVFVPLGTVTPMMSAQNVAKFQAYLKGFQGMQTDAAKLVPLLAQAMGMTPAQVQTMMSSQLPSMAPCSRTCRRCSATSAGCSERCSRTSTSSARSRRV
jgi:hypothetical protein